jgi:hypothetical protein
MQLRRAEKERKNLEMKNKNEQMMEAKRQLLINELKQNDEKVEKYSVTGQSNTSFKQSY